MEYGVQRVWTEKRARDFEIRMIPASAYFYTYLTAAHANTLLRSSRKLACLKHIHCARREYGLYIINVTLLLLSRTLGLQKRYCTGSTTRMNLSLGSSVL
ncbi:unnamed protein product [Cercospora beticola]|nr:unnamed protein product [Cercospora beticola]